MVPAPANRPPHTRRPGTLWHLLEGNARDAPDDLALRFLRDGERDEEIHSWSQLAGRARTLAGNLIASDASGKPVIIALPSGPDYIAALFACWRAGAIAVPSAPPGGSRHDARLAGITADSGAKHAFLPPFTAFSGLSAIHLGGDPPDDSDPADADPHSPCVIQYTSGSTARPKGVVLHSSHFLRHAEAIDRHFSPGQMNFLSWLPPWHDMGLVLKILQAVRQRAALTLLTPEHFIQRPLRWMEAISRHRAAVSGGPNFSFDACVRAAKSADLSGLDLSSWKHAPCGAERIRPETLRRFAETFAPCGFDPSVFRPGYGLAEATLSVTAMPAACGRPPEVRGLLSCGTPIDGVTLRIADAEGHTRPEGEEGEILVRGPTVAAGYWNRAEETAATFGRELRTGDLGFLREGHLYVSGRIKDLIILDGTNIAPEDIEEAACDFDPDIRAAAAFAEDHGAETATLLLEAASSFDRSRLDALRGHIAASAGVPVHRIALTRPGLLPRTTSGKIQRHQCRAALADHALRLSYDDSTAATGSAPGDVLGLVLASAAHVSGKHGLRADDNLAASGIGSLDATRLAGLLREKTGRSISIHELFAAASFRDMARSIEDARESAHPLPARAPGEGVLTRAQERMWFLYHADPSSAAYHVHGAVELTGPLDFARLERALARVVARHDMLTSRHGMADGSPFVWQDRTTQVPLEVRHFDTLEDARAELARFGSRPFDLSTGPPLRVTALSLASNKTILALCAHHIAADGWAMKILAGELAVAYRAADSILTEPASYAAFAARHRAWTDSPALAPQLSFWKNHLAGHPGVIDLPTDFPHPVKPSAAGGYVAAALPAELAARIAALAARQGITPFMFHLAAFALFLRHHGCGHDLAIAVPAASRNHSDSFSLVGTLVNTLPIRLRVPESGTFPAWLNEVRGSVLDILDHQDAPFERIVEVVQPPRVANRSPLVQVMIDHQELPVPADWDDGLTCRPFPSHRGASQFDLSLMILDFGGQQEIGFEFRSDLFREKTVRRFLARHLHLLDHLAASPPVIPSSRVLMVADDNEELATRSHGPARRDFTTECTLTLIGRRMSGHPDKTATVSPGRTLTYGQLAEHADRISAWLHARGVIPGDRVGVLMERDALLPAVLLAIWKRGAAFVPLDPSNPPARLALILADQSPLRVIHSPSLRGRTPADLPQGVELLEIPNEFHAFDPVADAPPSPSAPAYVIHTSGTTGSPKGVVISHAALANFLRSMAETPGFTEADHLLAITPLSFDISNLEIFLPLVCGGVVEILPSHITRDGIALRDHLAGSRASVMQATPATWRMLGEAAWNCPPGFKVLSGGEALDEGLARDLLSRRCQLWNLYGPTETTVWSTVSRITEESLPVTIGKPIANTGIHITDASGEPVPPGVPGHLRISGAGLADGYWSNPDLTTARFTTIATADGPVRAYDTGDFARWDHAGNLVCLGRSDHQIKIRGFRVEPGEIEAALLSFPGISQARVALRDGRILAWIVSSCGTGTDLPELRKHLADHLPPHMIPAEISAVPGFPLNASGKVDLSTLPDPVPANPAPCTAETETEKRLVTLWRELLETPAVSPLDDWFHLGGHSIQALRMFARIHREFGVTLPFSTLLTASSPRALAAAIDMHRTP